VKKFLVAFIAFVAAVLPILAFGACCHWWFDGPRHPEFALIMQIADAAFLLLGAAVTFLLSCSLSFIAGVLAKGWLGA
jgi:hypothetical protein